MAGRGQYPSSGLILRLLLLHVTYCLSASYREATHAGERIPEK